MTAPLFHDLFRLAALAGVLAAVTPAQDDATTLSRLLDGSDAVVVARVHRLTSTAPDRTGRQFVLEQAISGSAPTSFVLEEPAAAGCGRALHGLLPGQRVVLFLGEGASPRLLTSSARGVPLASQGLVDHLRALSRTVDPEGRANLLSRSLDHAERRVREDAALDLPYLPALASARPVLASRIARALEARDKTLGALVEAAARLGEENAIGVLLPAYLDAERPAAGADLTGFLQRSLLRFDHGAVARRAGGQHAATATAQHRAVALLARLETPEAQPALWQLLRTTATRSVAVAATRALLGHGVDPVAVSAHTHPTVMEAARRAPDEPGFRSVLRSPPPATSGGSE